jgi:hypothetical protein
MLPGLAPPTAAERVYAALEIVPCSGTSYASPLPPLYLTREPVGEAMCGDREVAFLLQISDRFC